MKKLIYIAGPIRRGSINHNVGQADDAMLALMKAGVAVINPMLSCWAGAGATRRDVEKNHGCGDIYVAPHPLALGGFRELGAEAWLTMDLEIVSRCDAVLRLPGESVGADGETDHAARLGIPVFHDLAALIEWGNRP